MTPVRTLALTVFLAAFAVFGPAAASAEPLPLFDGAMSFHAIPGSEGPEEFSWEVRLGEGQELRQIDDQHAGVHAEEDDRLVLTIKAVAAHDAVGTNVPTTLAVTAPNVITLTVHHRAGDPAAGGAPFTYPVIAGSGWEGGFQTHQVQMPPPTEASAPPPLSGMVATCLVPDLTGRSLKASRKLLQRSRCQLGPVRGERSKGAKVVKQHREPGRSLPAGARVGVKLG